MKTFLLVTYFSSISVLIAWLLYSILRKYIKKGANKKETKEFQYIEKLKLLDKAVASERLESIKSEVNLMTQLDINNRIKEVAFDANLGILKSTRNSEIIIAKQEAQKLLDVLRMELGISKSDMSNEESFRIIKTRLMNLTEMMAEAQVSLVKMDHRVVDIESIISQLPEILNTQREQIYSIHDSIQELRESTASKNDMKQLEKEFAYFKWTFGLIMGFLITLIGWLIKHFM
jgi:hypothetical protein